MGKKLRLTITGYRLSLGVPELTEDDRAAFISYEVSTQVILDKIFFELKAQIYNQICDLSSAKCI